MRVAVRQPSGALQYLHADHLGSTLAATDGAGQVVAGNQPRYDAYGKERTPSVAGLPTDFRYTGQRQDGTGLYDYGARRYDPALGAFLSPDTIVPQPGNPQSLNRYAYALGNPLRFADPTGHFSEDEIQKYLGAENWDEVLAKFGQGGELEGLWGWLQVLRLANLGDRLFVTSSDTRIDPAMYIEGVFGEQDGRLVINSGASSIFAGQAAQLARGSNCEGCGGHYTLVDASGTSAFSIASTNKMYVAWYATDRVDWTAVGLSAATFFGRAGLHVAVAGAATGQAWAATGGALIHIGAYAAGGLLVARDYAALRSGSGTGLDLGLDALSFALTSTPAGVPLGLGSLLNTLGKGLYFRP